MKLPSNAAPYILGSIGLGLISLLANETIGSNQRNQREYKAGQLEREAQFSQNVSHWEAQMNAEERRVVLPTNQEMVFYDFDGLPGFDGYSLRDVRDPLDTWKTTEIYISDAITTPRRGIPSMLTQPGAVCYTNIPISPEQLADAEQLRVDYYRGLDSLSK